MKILLATGNPHKAREIQPLLAGLDFELKTLKDMPEVASAKEDGTTLEENARKKAIGPAVQSGLWTLADDTGLEVAALNGAPGVYSARYAGPNCDFSDNIQKLLKELSGVGEENRGAVFRTVVALASPDGDVSAVSGRLEGRITDRPCGSGGFGYDPVFFVPEIGKTLAEIGAEEKNTISHRGRAMRAILPFLQRLLAASR